MAKRCFKCKITQNSTNFGKDKAKQDGLRIYCKSCAHQIDKAHYSRNIEKRRNKQRRYLGADPESTLRPEPDHCEACGTPSRLCKIKGRTGLHWDHDHSTGKHRGWLCTKCNHDETVVSAMLRGEMQHLIDYLKRTNPEHK